MTTLCTARYAPNIERDNRPASSSGASFFARPSQGIWLVMNCKGPWEGYKTARCLLPAFLCAHIFIERERRLGMRQTTDVSVTHAGCPMDNKDQLDWPHWLERKEGELLHWRRHEDIVNQMPVCLKWKIHWVGACSTLKWRGHSLLSFFTLEH